MIRTKLHILAQNIDPENGQLGRDNLVVQQMLAAASYVVDNEVLEILKREDATKSIKALIEAGLVRLPYNPMVVEFEVTPKHHEFALLREQDGCIFGRVTIMDNELHVAMVANKEMKLEIVNGGLVMTQFPARTRPEHEILIASFMTSVYLALLMLNTKGIEKEVVQVAGSMNKRRVAKGKPPIPNHSIVHVGTIYRRDGSAIRRTGESGGWHMPMHWRCGYTRRQHFGKGREEEKLVYIPPCIVNFKPEDDAPVAPKRKVKV